MIPTTTLNTSTSFEVIQHTLNKYVEQMDGKLFLLNVPSTGKELSILASAKSTEMICSKLWEIYIQSFPPSIQQAQRCYCCYKFVKNYGGLIAINEALQVTSIWDFYKDFNLDTYTSQVFKAMSEYVHSLPLEILHPFIPVDSVLGVPKSITLTTIWHHLAIEHKLPLVSERMLGTETAKAKNQYTGLKNSLPLSIPALKLAISWAKQQLIPRSEQFLPSLERFLATKEQYETLASEKQELFLWLKAPEFPNSFAGSCIGKFVSTIDDLLKQDKSEETIYNISVSFLASMDSTYQRPTGAPSLMAVKKLQDTLQECSLIESLQRTILPLESLDPNYLLYSSFEDTDIFSQLAGTVTVDPGKINAPTIPLSRLRELGFFGGAKQVSVLFESPHISNLMTLIGPTDKDHIPLTMWSNGISWCFKGLQASTLKERVKSQGGKVDAPTSARLDFRGCHCDLDLHFTSLSSSFHIYYLTRKGKGFELDIDANAAEISKDAVENIYGDLRDLPSGKYQYFVHNFCYRQPKSNTGFDFEFEHGDTSFRYSYDKVVQGDKTVPVLTITWNKETNTITEIDHHITPSSSSSSSKSSQSIWGINTNTWVPLTALSLSPNYWTEDSTGVGNSFLFMYLKGAIWGEEYTPRGIFNEALSSSLKPHKQALEALGGMIQVETPNGPQATGLGFSTSEPCSFLLKLGSKIYRVVHETGLK